MKSKYKVKRRSTVKKYCESLGLTNVFIYYSKEEGWHLESDQLDNWIGMDSGIIEMQITKLCQNNNILINH